MAQNILVGEDGIVKIADFGISKMLENGSAQKLIDAAGTPAFMAPELCSAEVAFSGQLADIWAIGATMYMLRFGMPPFVASNVMSLYVKIVNDALEFPNVTIDPGLRNLLVNMLEKDPKLRYSMDQVITHPWLRVAPAPPVLKKGSELRDSSTQNISRRTRGSTLQFTDKYLNEEAEAMNVPVITIDDKNDVFKSIGFGVGTNMLSDDEDAEEGGQDEDIMASNWALDVFEKVDDDDIDSDDDDDSVHEESTVMTDDRRGSATSECKPAPSVVRTRMEEKEEDRRSKEFKKRLAAKSSVQNAFGSNHRVKFGESADSPPTPSRKNYGRGMDRESSLGYLGEPVEEISMNDFEKMMDTLAMRSVSKNASKDSDDSSSHPDDSLLPVANVVYSPRHHNSTNGVVAVQHSEQGCRKSQEDRCVLSVSLQQTVKEFCDMESFDLGSSELEHLSCITVAAVFDGHSGQQCAQFLSENLIKLLVLKDQFYNARTQQQALRDALADLDRKVSALLLSTDRKPMLNVVTRFVSICALPTIYPVVQGLLLCSMAGNMILPHKHLC